MTRCALTKTPSTRDRMLIHSLVARAYDELHSLAYTLPRETLAERRDAFLEYVWHTRARFIRAIVALVWLIDKGHAALIQGVQDALSSTQRFRNRILEAQDRLYFVHRDLFSQRRWLSDIPAALDILMGGGYPRLPHSIQNCGSAMDRKPLWLMPRDKTKLTEALNKAIRLGLLFMKPIPLALTQCTISDGLIRFMAPGRISFALTLDSLRAGDHARWILCKIECLVKAREGESITLPLMDDRQRTYLISIIQKAMDCCCTPSGVVSDSSEKKEDKEGTTKLPDTDEMGEERQPNDIATNEKKKDDIICVVYDRLDKFCINVQMELLVEQAIALSKDDAVWRGQLSVTYHRENAVLDLSIWNEEYSAGIARTGGGVPMEGGNAKSVNDVDPPMGRFVRIYTGRRSGESDYGESLYGLHIQLGREWEVNGQQLVPDASNLKLDPGSVSMSCILMDAARAFTTVKAQAAILLLSHLLEPLGAYARIEMVPGHGSKVIVSIAGSTEDEKKKEEYGRLHLRLDITSGRWNVSGGSINNGEEEYAGLRVKSLPYTNLADALNLRSSASEQRKRLSDALRKAVEFTARLNAEELVRRILGIEPQKRWGALLGQQPPLEFLSCSVYVPLESNFEPAHHFQGCSGESNPAGNDELSTVGKDDTMVVLNDEVITNGNGSFRRSVSTTLLVATVPESNQSIVPKVFYAKKLSMVSGNYEQIEGCLKSLFDSAMQFIPWIRLERAMATVTPAFQCNETTLEKPNGLTLSIGTTSLHSVPALGTWVSFHCPGAESASLRWMGHVLGWEWKIKLEHHPLQPEQKIGSDLFSGKKLMCQLSSHSLPDGRYSLLEGLTIKIAELNEKEVSREDNEVPLQAQCGLVAGNYSTAATSLADIIEEARNLMMNDTSPKAEDEYYITEVTRFCVIMMRGDGSGGISLSHSLIALRSHPRCTSLAENGKGGLLLTLPPDVPECLSRELSKLPIALGSIKELLDVLSQTVQPAQMVTNAVRETMAKNSSWQWFARANGVRTFAVVCSFPDCSEKRRSVAFHFGSKTEGITIRGMQMTDDDSSWVKQCTLKEFAPVLQKAMLFLEELATTASSSM